MADDILPPAPRPCGSCPYRRDVPSGVWDLSEYEKLPQYDLPTYEQPPGVFLCHQQDGRACAGWTACHDMDESLGLRLASGMGVIKDPEPFLTYTTPTPLWDSGADAAAHGARHVAAPDADAQKLIDKLTQKRVRLEGKARKAHPNG